MPLHHLASCPIIHGDIFTFSSARATYFSPSDDSGAGGMHRACIRSVMSWRKGPPRHDCVFVKRDPFVPGMRGVRVARVLLFFRFSHLGITYPCAFVNWFQTLGDSPCPVTGMWMVKPEIRRRKRAVSVILLSSIVRGAHLIGVHGADFLPRDFDPSYSLDAFTAYYVNKFLDHHVHEMIF